MNPAPTKLQQIEAELAETRAKIAKLEKAKKSEKTKVEKPKPDMELKKRIEKQKKMLKDNFDLEIIFWFYRERTCNPTQFWIFFGHRPISYQCAILSGNDIPESEWNKYLKYEPTEDDEYDAKYQR
jgi:hypothetical protein